MVEGVYERLLNYDPGREYIFILIRIFLNLNLKPYL